jgi:CxxC motif-containing protein (DUF1111 family)
LPTLAVGKVTDNVTGEDPGVKNMEARLADPAVAKAEKSAKFTEEPALFPKESRGKRIQVTDAPETTEEGQFKIEVAIVTALADMTTDGEPEKGTDC